MRAFSFLALFCLGFAPGLRSQSITGTITGVVEDQTGGRAPGVTVLVKHTTTGVVYRSRTTEAGIYVVPLLPVGGYTVTVEMQGFKRFVREGVTLDADDRLRVDVRMEVGAMNEEIKVTAESPMLQTEQATLSGSFGSADFESLPINRDVLQVMQLLPGIQASKAGLAGGNINGSRDGVTDYKVDGAVATTANLAATRIQPISELVEEVVVQAGTYSAEFGRGAGQVSVTTRSGSNEIHGSFFYYFRNDALDANSFMNNVYGNDKPVDRHNLFGGTIGGPVRVPKLYNGRSRTFFSFGYEGLRKKQASQIVSNVPTGAMRQGDFTSQAAISDPATTRREGTAYVRNPFPQNIVPTARMDPVALKILEYGIPLPSLSGTFNNYVRTGPATNTNNAVNARVDHNFTDRSRLTTRYTYRRALTLNLMRFPGPAGAGADTTAEHTNLFQHLVSGDHVYVLRPNLISNLRVGFYDDYAPKYGPGTQEGWPAKVGLMNVAPDKFPLVTIAGFPAIGGANLADQRPGRNLSIAESITLIRGRHSLKTGFEYRSLQSIFWQPQTSSGRFAFNVQPTMDPRTNRGGLGLASFLLGVPTNTQFDLYPPSGFRTKWSYYAGFIQDDIRYSKRLVLNLGLRWETNTPRLEANNMQSNFDLATLQLRYAGQNGAPKTIYDASWRQFAPRIGLAYTPFRDTVIRAGYGIYYTPMNAVGDGTFTVGPWRRNYTWVSPDNGITFPPTLREGIPPVSFDQPFELSPLSDVNWMARSYPDSYVQQWSFNLQRQLAGATRIEAGYVGSKGTALQMNYQLNQVPGEKLGPGNAQGRRPYPTRGTIAAVFAPIGSSTYHAFQLRVERRMKHGFTAQGNYTFSKSLDNASGVIGSRAYGTAGVQDNYHLGLEKSVSGFDITHSFSIGTVYQLPAGKGRRFLNGGGPLPWVLGGWNLSALSSVRNGRPLIMTTATNLTGSLGGGSRPNRLRSGRLSAAEQDRLHWFDLTAYALPDAFTFGNTSRTEPDLRESGAVNLSAMLVKEFRITERTRVQVRAESFNALNHFNAGTPATTIGVGGGGTITSGGSGREMQLSLKLLY